MKTFWQRLQETLEAHRTMLINNDLSTKRVDALQLESENLGNQLQDYFECQILDCIDFVDFDVEFSKQSYEMNLHQTNELAALFGYEGLETEMRLLRQEENKDELS